MAFGNDLTINIKAKDQASNTLNKIRGNIKAHSAAFERAGKRMLVASAALTAGLGVAINQAAKFQQQMAQVSTMLDQQSMKYMPGFEKAIKSMSMEFGEGTDTLADGLYNILSASVPAEKAMSVLDASVKAAKAGLTDTGTAADAITTIINAYGMSADKAADVSDLLFAIVKRGKLTFAQLAPNIGKVASMAAKAGMTLENLGATISTLTRSGVRTEMAMTAVRGILNGMLKPADEAAKVFKDRLGVDMNTATLKAEGMVGVLKRMKDAGLKPEELAKMFPNVRGLVGVIAAMGDLEGITYDYNLMVNRAGLSQEAYEKNINTTAVTLRRLKAAFNIAATELGTKLLPYVEKMSDSLIKAVKWFTNLSEGTQKFIAVSIAVSAALLGISGAMLIIIAKIPMLIAGYAAVSVVLKKVAANALLAKGALTAGLGAAILFTAYKLTELTLKVKEYVAARKEMQETEQLASDMQHKAFGSMLEKFGQIKRSIVELNPEYAKQAEVIEHLKEKYFELADSGLASGEDLMAVENAIIEKVKEFIALKRQSVEVAAETSAEKVEIAQAEAYETTQIQDAERNAYQKINDQFSVIDLKKHAKKKALLEIERKNAIKQMKKDIKTYVNRKDAEDKINKIYAKKSDKLDKELARDKRQSMLSIASTSISTLQTILEAEGSSAKKKKGFIIALMTAELALGITRMWSAEATKGVLGVPLAIAGTAALLANYGAQMHRLTKGTSDLDIGGASNLGSDLSGASDTGGLDTGGETKVDVGNDYEATGVGSTVGSSGVTTGGGGGGGTSRITNINVGGVNVNLGDTNVSEDNLEETLRDIGEAVKSKTVEAVTMAMRIYNLGQDNEEEAV